MTAPDLAAAATVIDLASQVVDSGVKALAAAPGGIDTNQVLAYDLAHAASAVAMAKGLLDYGAKGDTEGSIACAFAADAVADLAGKVFGREAEFGIEPGALDGARGFIGTYRAAEFLAGITDPGPRHLDGDFEMVQDTFRRFADQKLAPIAEHIHRTNGDIPEDIIEGLAEMGAFGLSIPAEYGGYGEGGEGEYIGMVVSTEELSRGSLGAGGSLITRPEILARALIAGGTEEQKHEWLPKLAAAEVMNAVAVTEPDFGSDVAGVKVTATPTEGGWLLNGVKTWCTFGARADVLLVLARTDPDRSKGHRGLSMFIVPKDRGDSHGFELVQRAEGGAAGGGKMEGRPIDTIGYRGMHSYEVALEDWFVPAENLIGMDGGLGRGFYYQMAGFENGRLQTAARAIGVMQAAYEAARQYGQDRVVFGSPVGDYQLTKAKLGRMAVVIQASRQFSYVVSKLMAKGEGQAEASMVKAYVCKAAEWVTREAMQIHGGMGYAEEYDVSRYFVDARVLSIFEGADETLCLKVIAKKLVSEA
ncbi:acyl-CoA dehydrogenase family protein [Aquihabitans sp. McL0605]|uniref:acyl-CoA dehydrogenase family protein n=1 Tax=Aquihabitans sp. McL0605 TaxID=3415671 RepID=UPI003CEE0798